MGHQDVVPVNLDTFNKWTHYPYSGYFDGKLLWGRGSSDDKNGLIAILSTVETLIENGFKPFRSIVLSLGFDEEANHINVIVKRHRGNFEDSLQKNMNHYLGESCSQQFIGDRGIYKSREGSHNLNETLQRGRSWE